MSVDATTTSARAALVTTDWARQHLDDPKVRFLEVDVDTDSYDTGHLPGATGVNWKSQLTDAVRRDLVSREEFEAVKAMAVAAREENEALSQRIAALEAGGKAPAKPASRRKRPGAEI